MKYITPLVPGKLKKRYKRFLADVELDNGEIVTSHCPNSGSMKTCLGPDWPVMLLPVDNPARKCPYTLEMIHNGKTWIVVNTNRANELAFEAVSEGKIPELAGYNNYRREVKYGKNSRIDILCESKSKKCFVEVKSVTLVLENGNYAFPDAVTTRGQKHLDELSEMVKQGYRGVMLFMVLREDGKKFEPAAEIDPVYAEKLYKAAGNGVEILICRAKTGPEGLSFRSYSIYAKD